MKWMRLFHTVRHLRFEQVYYRLYYKIKHKLYTSPEAPEQVLTAALDFPSFPFGPTDVPHTYTPEENTFRFINRTHSFGSRIDWNFAEYGKLWVYNLNYFEWLNDESISSAERLKTIENHCFEFENIKDAKEPYPASLRGINWIRFLSKYNVRKSEIAKCLYKSYHQLDAFTEYQILANHLLENGFSLFYGAYYFHQAAWFKKARNILTEQLNEQVLADGAHYETSPMYHCILLQRLFHCIELARSSDRFEDPGLLLLMEEKAGNMLGWLHAFLLDNGNYPMIGDAAPGIAPSPQSLFRLGIEMDIHYQPVVLKESGLRKIKHNNWELVVDIADIMPSYQPGHTHADTFHFEIYRDGNPILVDTGISTYEQGPLRDEERSTHAHNTIEINGKNSSDVWNRFRVGKRAKVIARAEGNHSITAAHNGYQNEGIIHERSFSWDNQKIIITDRLKGYDGQNALLYLHFHPHVVLRQVNESHFEADGIHLRIDGGLSCDLRTYQHCEGYHQTRSAPLLVVEIREHATLSIEL